MLIDEKKQAIVGADETGVGDYFSPLVATAVFIPLDNINFVRSLGVQDSKNLSDQKIVQIAHSLKKYVFYQTNFFNQKTYNELTKTYNANELKMFLHLKSINSLTKQHLIDLCVIDKFSTTNTIYQYQDKLINANLGLEKITQPLILEHQAESKFLAVAAASILARAFFLEKMQEQNQQWNTIFPFGVSAAVEEFGKEFVKLHGEKSLWLVAKVSFKTTQKILAKIFS